MPSDAANKWTTAALALIGESNNTGFHNRLALAFDAGQLHMLQQINAAADSHKTLNWVGEQIQIMKDYE